MCMSSALAGDSMLVEICLILQRVAEKVHKDTKLCEGYLDDVEQKLNEVRIMLL